MILKSLKNEFSLKNTILSLLGELTNPKSPDEDIARTEHILNIILLMSILLVASASFMSLYDYFALGDGYKATPPFLGATLLSFFIGLLLLSRRGFVRLASALLVALYFLSISSGIYYFGADQPQTLLSYAVVIVIAGILLGSRSSFIATLFISVVLLVFGYLQTAGTLSVQSYWKEEGVRIADIIIFSITFGVLAVVSWLSNREIKKSLFRARDAESGLRRERDLLEEKVKERTLELEQLQVEKTKQMQSFVEFGRNASGMFHDMVNPIQASVLALYNIKKKADMSSCEDFDSSIDDVVMHLERAREFLNIARGQITTQDISTRFSVGEQIENVFKMLSFKAKRSRVALVPPATRKPLFLLGNPISFHRLIAGLVSNAIDAYDGFEISQDKKVVTVGVAFEKASGFIVVLISDNGKGISEENKKKVFNLFFTTKDMDKGTGIGLVLCRDIVEKEFGGTLDFVSEEGKGTTFVVKIPAK